MSGFTKLHSSIATSSVMAMPLPSRWLWCFLLSQANAEGIVEGAVPGLAIAAAISLEECQTALDAFLAPDKYSRTPDNEGRRLVEIPGGWRITSYAKWRYVRSAEERREYDRNYKRDRRARQKADAGRSRQRK
jgi:hypothetical protein